MYCVNFGGKNSFNDFGLYLAHKTISEPAIKTAYVSIPGGNGTLDYTDFFGEPLYNNRTISLDFLSMKEWDAQMKDDSTVKNALHGKKMEVRFDDDPGWYWVGRVSVGAWQYDKGAGKLPVTVTADPFKLADEMTAISAEVDAGAEQELLLVSGRKTVQPIINTGGAAFQLAYSMEGTAYTVQLEPTDADQRIEEFLLSESEVSVTVKNTSDEPAKITFSWRDGSL